MKACVGLHVHDGTTKAAERAWIRTGGALKKFFGNYAVSVPDAAEGHGSSASTIVVYSENVTAVVEGAIGTVTYAWTRTDADPHPWSITNPSSATTRFTTSCARNAEYTASFHVTATDSAGQVVSSSDVTVTCSNDYFGGGLP
jgi:hypothetical protein